MPDDVFESWNTQPVIAGSDSDLDEQYREDDDVLTDSGPGVNEGMEKLSSSLISLDLDGPPEHQPADIKGKQKAVDVKRTPTRTGQSDFLIHKCSELIICNRKDSEETSHS